MQKKMSNEEFYQDFIQVDEALINLPEETDFCPILDSIRQCSKRYELNEKIDRGGSKKISRVLDYMTSRQIALAELIDENNPEGAEKFFSEIFLTASLEHPNIIPIYDAGLNGDGKPFFTMKLIEGKNLNELIKSRPKEFSLQQAIDIFLKICDAIDYAHSKNIIHLDLKPANIQIGKYGEVLVCDWGIAKIINDDMLDKASETHELDPNIINDVTLDGFIKGSPGFLAPEQIDASLGDKNFSSDTYALGGILYFLLSFRAPYEHCEVNECLKLTLKGKLRTLNKVDHDQFKVPSSLAAVAVKALSNDQSLRYQSVSDLRHDVLKWRDGFATEAENASFLVLATLLLKRHKVLSTICLIFIFTSFFFIYQIKTSEKSALEQKAIANENALLAKENERKAIKALELYKKEKKVAVNASLEAAPALYEKALNLMRVGQFQKVENELLLTLKRDKNFTPAKVLLGELYFIQQKYQKAYSYIEAERIEPYSSHFLRTLKNFKNVKPLNEVTLLKLINDLKYIQLEQMACLYFIQNTSSQELKVEIIKLLLKRSNSHIKLNDLSIKYIDGKLNVDLSKTKDLRYLIALNGLNIDKLNLANTGILHASEFKYIMAREIDMQNTNIDLFHEVLYLSKLKKIILSKNAYNYLNYADFPHLIIEFR